MTGLHSLAVTSGYIGAVCGVSMVVPQILRTLRDRHVGGVSALSWSLTALGCLTWMLYGIRAGEVPQVPGNVLIVSGAAVIVLAVPSTRTPLTRSAGLAAGAVALVLAAVILPTEVLGLLAIAFGLVSSLPQTVASVVRPKQADSAVSALAWGLRAASQVFWLLYAIVLRDAAVTISAVVVLSSALVVLASELRRAPQLATALPAPAGRCPV